MQPKYWNKGKIHLSNKDKVLKKIIDQFSKQSLNLNDNSFHALISISDGLELQVPDDGTSSIIVNLINDKEAEDISKLKIVLASDSSERSDLIVDENNDIIDILVTENIDTQWQLVVNGVIIIIAVGFDELKRNR